MNDLIVGIKKIFGKYEPNYEYWVRLSDIKIPPSYFKTKVGEEKWKHKLYYWRKTGEFESKILIDKNFNLVDGYSSCKIAYLNGITKVPVYFVE